VGRRTVTLVDAVRGGRRLDVDVWYPATASDAPPSVYEIFPGVAFGAATAQHHAPAAAGRFPVLLFSHGRTGMRISYSMVCEALAARGMVVLSADHPGDALPDWLTAQQVDDRTNETNRVGDAHLVLQALLSGHPEIPAAITEIADADRVALAGHSYGAYTAYATAAGARGVSAHERVRAVIGFQPFMRTMSDALLGRVGVPSLLVCAELDG
jgi:predicted dienelactone hydrolase